jgi:SAM-dependent methyltransferase
MPKIIKSVINLAKRWALAFIAPRPLIGIFYLPRFVRHWLRYKNMAIGVKPRLIDSYPCLTDWTPYTPFDPHYFFQGAWLARQLEAQKPQFHVDIASSVMMVGTVSAHVDTVFVDFRPIKVSLKGMTSVASNIANLPFATGSLSSLSCLHVIEHIGLGRYGDPIDPQGSVKAALELQRTLARGGRLYISAPVGDERIEFNAHRVFSPRTIPGLFDRLQLIEFSYVDDAGVFHQNQDPSAALHNRYACGMYVFTS